MKRFLRALKMFKYSWNNYEPKCNNTVILDTLDPLSDEEIKKIKGFIHGTHYISKKPGRAI